MTIDFLRDADNVYRTKHFIVKQEIELEFNSIFDNTVISHDTYYMRTPTRDAQYEKAFSSKENIDGKRMKASTYTRNYVF